MGWGVRAPFLTSSQKLVNKKCGDLQIAKSGKIFSLRIKILLFSRGNLITLSDQIPCEVRVIRCKSVLKSLYYIRYVTRKSRYDFKGFGSGGDSADDPKNFGYKRTEFSMSRFARFQQKCGRGTLQGEGLLMKSTVSLFSMVL